MKIISQNSIFCQGGGPDISINRLAWYDLPPSAQYHSQATWLYDNMACLKSRMTKKLEHSNDDGLKQENW